MAGMYRAPDEKTIRVVLDRLDPRALAPTSSRPRRLNMCARASRLRMLSGVVNRPVQ